jgi:hypothetical protein
MRTDWDGSRLTRTDEAGLIRTGRRVRRDMLGRINFERVWPGSVLELWVEHVNKAELVGLKGGADQVGLFWTTVYFSKYKSNLNKSK